MKIDIKLLPHQMEIFNAKEHYVCMSCAIGAGKTFTAAFLAITRLLRGDRILTIVPSYSVLNKTFIYQMKLLLNQYNIPFKWKAQEATMYVGRGEMICKTNMNCETINGLSFINTVIMDECRLIKEEAFWFADARQRAVENTQMFCFGTGCSKSNWFARLAMRDTGESKFKVKWLNVDIYANVKHNGKDYVDRMIESYANLPEEFKKRELYGLFTDGDERTIFSKIKTDAPFKDGLVRAGMDLASDGGDWSAVAVFKGNKLVHLEKQKTKTQSEILSWKSHLDKIYNINQWTHDSTGSAMALMEIPGSNCINFGWGAGPKFKNFKTLMYFYLKEMLEEGICIDESAKPLWDREGLIDLTAQRLDDREAQTLALIQKKVIKKEIGRSPDVGDALALASIPIAKLATDEHIYRQQRIENPYRINI